MTDNLGWFFAIAVVLVAGWLYREDDKAFDIELGKIYRDGQTVGERHEPKTSDASNPYSSSCGSLIGTETKRKQSWQRGYDYGLTVQKKTIDLVQGEDSLKKYLGRTRMGVAYSKKQQDGSSKEYCRYVIEYPLKDCFEATIGYGYPQK